MTRNSAFKVPILILLLEFMAVLTVSMEKGKSALFLVGMCRPLAFVCKPSNYKIKKSG